MIQLEPDRAKSISVFAGFAGMPERIFEMPAQVAMHNRNRPVIKVAHQDHGMGKVFGQQNGLAQYFLSLKLAFTAGQSQVAVKNVQHGVFRHFDVHANAVSDRKSTRLNSSHT